MMRLGINIDHVATLREARKEGIPDVIEAAKAVIAGGADGIVCHLREDRRHINDKDVVALRKLPTRLDLEMAATDEMLKIALKIKPEMVTLVPEKRQELTTEGGLDVIKYSKKLKNIIKKLQGKGIKVSLFIEPEKKQIEEAAVLVADFIEIHTGRYGRLSCTPHLSVGNINKEIDRIGIAAEQARWIGLKINAGHGLDYNNVKAVANISGIEELNIGFSVIARSLFVGLEKAVREMKACLRQPRRL
ncbi:MAG: pyridoxine 5'-phosphate synthase [bacterium]